MFNTFDWKSDAALHITFTHRLFVRHALTSKCGLQHQLSTILFKL